LFTDQQRFDTIAAAGYPHMITPNLDRLASEGCLYTYAHTSNPVCMAARHDLLTGLPARAHGYYSNHRDQPIKDYSLPTIARIFSENGYRTASVGKMHFQPFTMHHGYSERISMEEIPRRRQDDDYASFLKDDGLEEIQNIHGVRANLYHVPQQSQMDEAHHPNRWVADQTMGWLDRNGEEPFFLFSSWIHPHPPWASPNEFQGRYKDRDIPLPHPRARSFPFEPEFSPLHGDDDTPEEIRSVREAYYGCVTHVDFHIGRVLDYLRETGKIDDTLIIFTSDHGEMLYDRGMMQKFVPYDSSTRVPMIVRYPELVKAGTASDQFVDLLDILPTCLDVCGLTYPQGRYELPGDSIFAEGAKRRRDRQISCFGMGAGRWVMNRSHRYKYVYHYNGATEEFFDMQNDPGEQRNLIGTGRLPQEAYSELKQGALTFEQAWAPEDMVQDDGFAIVNGSKRISALHGNTQFHVMDRRPPTERGERFIQECEYAMETELNHGKKVTEVFNDLQYIRRFMKDWAGFGGEADALGRLFAIEDREKLKRMAEANRGKGEADI
jgi:arylsulfatase A-like enzyme